MKERKDESGGGGRGGELPASSRPLPPRFGDLTPKFDLHSAQKQHQQHE